MEKLYALLQKKVKLKVLIAPLDWGLGHASRCIPIIKYFQEKEVNVYLASSGDAGTLLQEEFPDLPYFRLPAYTIHYKNHFGLTGSILSQIPGLKKAIRQEHSRTEELVSSNKFDFIISDNRYGVWAKNSLNILLIHQLGIRSPFLQGIFGPMIRKYHYRYIRPFDRLWIPDFPGSLNLSGALSHGFILPKPGFFIGPQSKFSSIYPYRYEGTADKKILAVLSGPEPYRSQFEFILIHQAEKYNTEVTIVRGVIREEPVKASSTVKLISYLTSDLLLKEYSASRLIICRSGYSSIMDLACTGHNAILIPTPGQTEQEYLASYHHQKGHYFTSTQQSFDLHESLNKSLSCKGLHIDNDRRLLDNAFENIICEF
ncbi:MAG: glycosyltransferase [Bacteroidales bacterium]